MTGKVPISILIPTLNEEANLAETLSSCGWADQVVVLDSFSSDNTESIARSAGAEFVQHRFEDYSAQKNWALDSLHWRNAWIFILDADERFTSELVHEITALLVNPAPHDGYFVNRRLMFLGKWVRHCGWYPNWNLRYFRLGFARYDGRAVHEHMEVKGSVGYLRADLIHEDRKGLWAYIDRHNRYSTFDALSRVQETRTPLSWRALRHPTAAKRFLKERIWPYVPAKPLTLFLYLYVLRLGVLDGGVGLQFCLLQAQQEFHTLLKMKELKMGAARKSQLG